MFCVKQFHCTLLICCLFDVLFSFVFTVKLDDLKKILHTALLFGSFLFMLLYCNNNHTKRDKPVTSGVIYALQCLDVCGGKQSNNSKFGCQKTKELLGNKI